MGLGSFNVTYNNNYLIYIIDIPAAVVVHLFPAYIYWTFDQMKPVYMNTWANWEHLNEYCFKLRSFILVIAEMPVRRARCRFLSESNVAMATARIDFDVRTHWWETHAHIISNPFFFLLYFLSVNVFQMKHKGNVK